MEQMKRIGILTSGGDAPGMNAAVRAAALAAAAKGIKLYGIQQGYKGLHEGNWDELTLDKVDRIHAKGGTILRTARFMPFCDPETLQPAIDECLRQCKGKIDGLIVIGGDGSFRGAQDLSKNGLPCVGLPATIDNDISCTDYTIGFDTALNTVMRQVDTIADTAHAHDRCMVIETMGNKAGALPLYGSIASGATAVMLSEFGGYDFPAEGEMSPALKARFEGDIIEKVREAQARGREYFIVFVAESITGKRDKQGNTCYPGGAEALAKFISKTAEIDARAHVLAYVQRGGSPTARDRLLATKMGDYAVNLLAKGLSNRVVGICREELVDYEIGEGLRMKKQLSEEDYQLALRVAL